MYYLKQRTILVNLIVMSIGWLVVSFNYYLLTFLSNTFEKVYLTAFLSGCSAVAGNVSAAALQNKVGVKSTLNLGFGLSVTAGALLLSYGLSH